MQKYDIDKIIVVRDPFEFVDLCNSVHEEARAADRPPIMGFSVHIDV
jgi:hypothetical protein